MPENQIGHTDTFFKPITASDGDGIIEVWRTTDVYNEYANLVNTYHLGKNFYLEAFSGAIDLPSLAEAPFPETFPEMNAAEKIAAMLKIEEEFPFIGLRFYCKKGASGVWNPLSTARLQNKGRELIIPFGIPYLSINELKILGSNDCIGIQVINYGHGVLGPGDYININGDYRFHVDLVAKPTRVIGAAIPYGVDIPSSTPLRFRLANLNRAILYVTNAGSAPVWLGGNDSVAVGSGLYLAPKGNGNLTEETLTGEFWAIAESGSSRVCGIEASYG
jgi:hypothetical protein